MNRDVWDLDWAFEQSLITLAVNGKPTRLVVTGGKSAIFDAVNRVDGKYAVLQGPRTAKPVVAASIRKPARRSSTLRSSRGPGRTDVDLPRGDRRTKLADDGDLTRASSYLYVPLLDNNCMDYSWVERDADKIAAAGMDVRLGARPKPGNDGNFGRIEAIDLKTSKVVWSKRQRAPIASSLLASAGGLVFSGARDRRFRAYDAATGAVLWQIVLNASPSSSPATYSVAGIAVSGRRRRRRRRLRCRQPQPDAGNNRPSPRARPCGYSNSSIQAQRRCRDRPDTCTGCIRRVNSTITRLSTAISKHGRSRPPWARKLSVFRLPR